jgi:hypothetical protein
MYLETSTRTDANGPITIGYSIAKRGLVRCVPDMMFNRIVSDTVFHTLEEHPEFAIEVVCMEDGTDITSHLSEAERAVIDMEIFAAVRRTYPLTDSTIYDIMED